MLTMTVECDDCHMTATIPNVGVNYFSYGHTSMQWGFGLVTAPALWPQRINVVNRCAACHEKHLAAMQPVWAQQDQARNEKLAGLSIVDLLDEVVMGGLPSTMQHEALAVLRKRLAGVAR